MKYTIEIPDELHKYMVEGNWDVQAYIKQVLLDPLIKRFESEKKASIMAVKIAEVDDAVKEIHNKAEIKDFEIEKAAIVSETTEKVTAEVTAELAKPVEEVVKEEPIVEEPIVEKPIEEPIETTTEIKK